MHPADPRQRERERGEKEKGRERGTEGTPASQPQLHRPTPPVITAAIIVHITRLCNAAVCRWRSRAAPVPFRERGKGTENERRRNGGRIRVYSIRVAATGRLQTRSEVTDHVGRLVVSIDGPGTHTSTPPVFDLGTRRPVIRQPIDGLRDLHQSSPSSRRCHRPSASRLRWLTDRPTESPSVAARQTRDVCRRMESVSECFIYG